MSDINGFFTITQAQELAQQTQMECRRIVSHSKRSLVFSHITALRLAGLTLQLDTTLSNNKLHITVSRDTAKSKLQGVQEHVWRQEMTYAAAPDELVMAVTPQQAICQMAPFTTQDSLTIAMDFLTCHNDSLRQLTHQELSDYIYGLSRFTGSARCKAALARSVEGTDSPQESLLRLKFIDRNLPCPKVNHPIEDIAEHRVWLVDMAYPDEHVAVEYDGEYHYDKQRWNADLHKRNRLQHLGWRVLVATKNDLANRQATDAFVTMVARALGQSRQRILSYGHA